jgi:hypothetical protein
MGMKAGVKFWVWCAIKVWKTNWLVYFNKTNSEHYVTLILSFFDQLTTMTTTVQPFSQDNATAHTA